MGKIKLLLVDDHAVFRAGLKMLLNAQPDMEVVGEAASGEEALRKIREIRPELALIDITMPGMGGLEAIERIKADFPSVKVLVLTMHDDEGYLRQVLRAGGSGYVLKKAADTELLSAIRAAYRGEVFLHPAHAKAVVEELILKRSPREGPGRREYGGLSPREQEVLKLVALGYTNQQIADKLFVSVKTVEVHRAHIMEKLNLRSRVELVRYALQKGILKKEE